MGSQYQIVRPSYLGYILCCTIQLQCGYFIFSSRINFYFTFLCHECVCDGSAVQCTVIIRMVIKAVVNSDFDNGSKSSKIHMIGDQMV